MDWNLLSFILSSEKRERIIWSLVYPTTPTRISKETDVSKAHTTRILKKLEELGLVECKTPEKRKGKLYVLSDKGRSLLETMKKTES